MVACLLDVVNGAPGAAELVGGRGDGLLGRGDTITAVWVVSVLLIPMRIPAVITATTRRAVVDEDRGDCPFSDEN